LRATMMLIKQLRTVLHHSLDLESERDSEIDQRCGRWCQQACGTAVPASDQEWEDCLRKFLAEVEQLVGKLIAGLRDIERHEAKEELLDVWRFRKLRYRSPFEFDNIVVRVAADIGRENLDAAKFRARYYDEWLRALDLIKDESTIESEIRRLIEYALMADAPRMLPISGNDVMREFSLPPGPKIGELLKEGKRIFATKPRGAEELLDELRRFL
jgi:hypothetical protein